MKIVLFDESSIYEYDLSALTSDTFSNVKNIEVLNNLVDIHIKNNEYIMYSNSNTILFEDKELKEISLSKNEFYKIIKNNKEYLLLVQDIKDETMSLYNYNNDLNLIIGNNDEANIIYDIPYIKDNIIINTNPAYIEITNNKDIYINNKHLDNNKIHYGDRITIYGLVIYIYKDLIIINNPNNKVAIKEELNLTSYNPIHEEYLDIELLETNNNIETINRNKKTIKPIIEKEIIIKSPSISIKLQRIPLKIAIIPSIVTGIVAIYFLIDILSRLTTAIDMNDTTLGSSWKNIIPSALLLLVSILIPYIIHLYNKSLKNDEDRYIEKKKKEQLKLLEEELKSEQENQKKKLSDNYKTTIESLRNITTKNTNLWSKSLEDKDLLSIRLGIGSNNLKYKITSEEPLSKEQKNVINKYKIIKNTPLIYSLYDNRITNIIGIKNKRYTLLNNIILELMSNYYYEDIKFIILTDDNSNLEYLKYSKYSFNNPIRYYATNIKEAKYINDYLLNELEYRSNNHEENTIFKPYYIIITDNYAKYKNLEIVNKTIKEDNSYSLIILNDLILPNINNIHNISLNNDISLLDDKEFQLELEDNINMMEINRILSNIINTAYEIDNNIPDSIDLLGLENLGNIEQLDIENRWNTNYSKTNLPAKIGISEEDEIIELDIVKDKNEIITGNTNSDKTELMINYILSLAINYSPSKISFILVDTNNGELIQSFNNKLPHIIGIINNKNKNDIDRVLISIENEIIKREENKDNITNHILIMIDEEDVILTNKLLNYRRDDLNIHLVLATSIIDKKVISLFTNRITFRLDNTSDSKKVIGSNNATKLNNKGRFYMYNSIDNSLILAQSPNRYKRYYPKDKYVKELNKKLEIINDSGQIIKCIQAKLDEGVESSNNEFHLIEKQIESLSYKNNYIYSEPLKDKISLEDIKDINYEDNTITAIIGKYDDITNKSYNNLLLNIDSNILILSNNIKERENILNTILYTTINKYTTDELNYYIVDYENKAFKNYQNIPHIGDIIYKIDKDKLTNFYSLFKSEIERRKTLKIDKLSKVVIIINNYNEFIKNNNEEDIQELLLKANKYGIYFIIANNTIDTIDTNTKELFSTIITLHLKEEEYKNIYQVKKVINIKDTLGRGLYKIDDDLYEFQTIIIPDTKVKELSKKINNSTNKRVKRIPIFPRFLDYEFIKFEIDGLNNVPISITKKDLDIVKYDFTQDTFHMILSKNIDNTTFFINSLIDVFNKIKNNKVFILDPLNILNINKANCYIDNFDGVLDKLNKYYNRIIDRESNSKGTPIVIINSLKELTKNISDIKKIDDLFKLVKKVNKAIVIINEEEKNIANLSELPLFKKNISLNKGIWVGKKINNQNIFKIDEQVKESYMDVGYIIDGENIIPSKLINFYSREEETNEKR